MWTKHLISTERGNFEYFKCGDGEPLCITHQYIEFNEKEYNFAGKFIDHYCVYLVNLKECGNSDVASNNIELSMESSVQDLEAIRRSLNFEQWGFAGHSTGGMIGLIYGINYPKSLNKLIIGGTCYSSEYINHIDSIYCKNNPNNNRLLEIINLLNDPDLPLQSRRNLNKEWNLISFYKKSEFDELMKNVYLGKTNAKRLNYFTTVNIKNFNVKNIMHRISVPTYIYVGQHDSQCPAVFSKEIASQIPNASFKAFKQSSHNPFVEEPDEFMEFVLTTINK